MRRSVLRNLLGTAFVLMLAAVFAWYFRGDLPVDLALWWAACFSP